MAEPNGRVAQLEEAIEELKRILEDHIPPKELKAILADFDARISENTAKVNLIEARTMEEIGKIRSLLQTRLGALEFEQRKSTSALTGVHLIVEQMNSKLDRVFVEVKADGAGNVVPFYSVTEKPE